MQPQVRKYFVAAEVAMWDYAPSGRDLVKDAAFPDAVPPPPPGSALQMDHSQMDMTGTWMANSRAEPYRIGRHYLKMVFKEYTDHTFTARKARAAEDEHLGVLGPTLRAEVGDAIQVVFRNHAPTGFMFSMHPHGVKYGKAPVLLERRLATLMPASSARSLSGGWAPHALPTAGRRTSTASLSPCTVSSTRTTRRCCPRMPSWPWVWTTRMGLPRTR